MESDLLVQFVIYMLAKLEAIKFEILTFPVSQPSVNICKQTRLGVATYTPPGKVWRLEITSTVCVSFANFETLLLDKAN